MPTPADSGAAGGMPAANYLSAGTTLKSWLTTHDHKRIALLYLVSITAFFFIGGAAATLIRLELVTPAGDLVSHDTYNKLFTMHGVIMVWLFLIPSIPSVLGNFLMPMMIGARDLAFPRLNLASWYIYVAGGLFTLAALIAGGVDTGWTFYTPFSTMFSNTHVILVLVGVFIVGFSSILTGLNFIVTVHTMRAPGMTWFRLPLFVWANYATRIILVLATPVLAMTLLLLAVERLFGVGIFDPALGGDPLLFQHLFWFYSHPAVYIMVLPAMGVVSEIIPCFARKRVFGYRFMAYAILGIAVIGFLVWGHHMFVTGQSVYAGMVFSLLSFLVAIPSAIKVFNWTATLYKGSITLSSADAVCAGLRRPVHDRRPDRAVPGVAGDRRAPDRHLFRGRAFPLHHGRRHGDGLPGRHPFLVAEDHRPHVSGNLGPHRRADDLLRLQPDFFPQYLLGYCGMPRRYHTYPPEFQLLNVLSSAGASILAVGYLLPLGYLVWSLFYGKRAGPNPWHATGLEWQTPSPPPTDNFGQTPVVTEEPYAYAPQTGSEVPQ